MFGIFISGGTGYIGSRLAAELIARGHRVAILSRPGSESKVSKGASTIAGDALDSRSFRDRIAPAKTFIHLTGVSHPAPWKEKQFRAVDLASLQASVQAAAAAGIEHFIYVSVAHPAPTMKAYVRVRMECEEILRRSEMATTILRPWYVLGPGHRWPVVLKPLYRLAEALGSEGARRLGLVSLPQMIAALVWAAENPPPAPRILDVPAIRNSPVS